MKSRLLNGVRLCGCCGARVLLQGYHTKSRLAYIMKKEGICHDCAFWKDIAAYPPENMEVIGNVCMRICPSADGKDRSLTLGGGGRRRFFMRPDRSVFESNDVWTIGKIPQRFQPWFKTTAVEIPSSLYKRLSKNRRVCQSRACLDRYDCIRYNLALEEEKGPYNKVPSGWKSGDEHCGFFIDRRIILTDESSVLK